jgi:hypothetical protein
VPPLYSSFRLKILSSFVSSCGLRSCSIRILNLVLFYYFTIRNRLGHINPSTLIFPIFFVQSKLNSLVNKYWCRLQVVKVSYNREVQIRFKVYPSFTVFLVLELSHNFFFFFLNLGCLGQRSVDTRTSTNPKETRNTLLARASR